MNRARFPKEKHGYFYIFFLLGGGEGEVRGDREGGGRVFIETPRRGVSREGGRGGREGVCGEFGGGGAKFFFSGPKCPPT